MGGRLLSVFIVFILIVFVGIWLLFFRGETAVEVPGEGDIIIFGDSLAEGLGASPGDDLSSQLSRRVGLPVINAGKSGDTTGSAMMRLEKDVLSQNPRLVIILLGGNDALQQAQAQTVYDNLSVMIRRIQQKKSAVLLLGVRSGLLSDPYAHVFERLSREYKTEYIPNILAGVLGDSNLMTDAIHPNSAGYAKIAARIEPVLRKMLGM